MVSLRLEGLLELRLEVSGYLKLLQNHEQRLSNQSKPSTNDQSLRQRNIFRRQPILSIQALKSKWLALSQQPASAC